MPDKDDSKIKKEAVGNAELPTPPIKKKDVKSDVVEVTHTENRKRDIRLGRETYRFKGRETVTIPRNKLKSKDWEGVKKHFRVKE